ncbi:MAG: protein kinase domain-containing protein, partial [Pyrinomonadaceae bacterium]
MTGVASRKFGRYEIREKLGEGGMGEVYSAMDAELGRNVAIKLLPSEFSTDPDRKSRFKQEARVVSALNHPNVITIYEIGENEHGSFLATEFVDGKTLREVIKNDSLTLFRILKIVEQVANGLVAAHQAKIIHRDIKPENIMVRRDSIVKVLDFGLAKPSVQIDGENGANKTIPGTVMGSARYMSPEQARGLIVDERTDIWSLGVVLYELLVGKSPFDGETTADTIASVIYREPEPLNEVMPNLPDELHRILRRALQKDRDERYQSVKDFALDIKNLLYEIEHANSGERASHVIPSPQFSENPTMIHRTVSGNHPTNRTEVVDSAEYGSLITRKGGSKLKTILAAAGAIVLLAAVGFGVFKWYQAETPLVADAFARPQIIRISTDGKVNAPAISPDGKYVAYVAGEVGNRSLIVRQISTDSSVTVVPATNLNLHSVTFSPDGDYVYYCQTRSDFSINILYQVPALGGTSRKLIEDVDSTITFSPNGKQFAFIRYVSASNETKVLVVNTASLETTELATTKGTPYDFLATRPAWSPNGRSMLLAAGKREGGIGADMSIIEVGLEDKQFRELHKGKFFTVGNFAWFADGSGFLFAGRETQTSPVQVWRTSYPNMDFRQITNDFNDYSEIGLSDDGRTILTLKSETISSMWSVAADGKDQHQITVDSRNLEGQWGLLQLSDGSMIYSKTEAKKTELWRAAAEVSNAKKLFSEAVYHVAPVLSPDGKVIIFNLQKEKSSRIWKMNVDGTNAVALTEDNPEFGD